MLQTKHNHKPYNYAGHQKMITLLLNKRKLVLVQRTEIERMDRLSRKLNAAEITYLKRLMCETKSLKTTSH